MTRVELLTIPDCPNGPLLAARLADAVAGRAGVLVEHRVVADEDAAARLGMHGSPTVLIDGRDPFAAPGMPTSLSCRLYRGPDGLADGAPPAEDLRRELDRALAGDRVGRAGRGRLAPTERGQRAVQQAILRSFGTAGSPPDTEELDRVAARGGVLAAEVLAELAAEDFLTLDEDGRIKAAYPFSVVPTETVVAIEGGPRVWAMCAIDALGIPAMLAADVVITSTDPLSGAPIRVEYVNGTASWQPRTAVVYKGACGTPGPAAEVCCGYMRFFTDHATATTWAAVRPEVTGLVLDQTAAQSLGEAIFGGLLTGQV